MKLNNFRGELTGISAKKEPLLEWLLNSYTIVCWTFESTGVTDMSGGQAAWCIWPPWYGTSPGLPYGGGTPACMDGGAKRGGEELTSTFLNSQVTSTSAPRIAMVTRIAPAMLAFNALLTSLNSPPGICIMDKRALVTACKEKWRVFRS